MKENFPQIFISYAKEDKSSAMRLYNDLKKSRLSPWLDTERLLPGQLWENAIEEAIEESRFFIAVLSTKSVDKIGIVQKELKKALSILERHPEKDVFLIPVRIENCEPSSRKLREIHWVDMFPDWEQGLAKIISVIKIYTVPQNGEFLPEVDIAKEIKSFTTSQQGQTLAKILKLFSTKKELTRRQVSLELETSGTITRAYLEMLRHKGMLSRTDHEHSTLYILTENGELVLNELRAVENSIFSSSLQKSKVPNEGSKQLAKQDKSTYEKLEKLMPELLAEMRADLDSHPLRREFVLLSKSWSYWAKGNELVYYFEEHPELKNKIRILQNHGLVDDITYNEVDRYIISEDLVEYLVS